MPVKKKAKAGPRVGTPTRPIKPIMVSAQDSAASNDGGGLLRSFVSLALVIHLCCIAVVLGSNCPSWRRAPLQADLVRVFARYTQLLDFDPQFTPYYHTLGRSVDD